MWFKEFLFTAAYTGYFPVASGTAGSLLGMALYIGAYLIFGAYSWIVNLVFVMVMLYPAVKLGDTAEEYFGVKDPSEMVLDEVLGYQISVLFYPFSWKLAICAFFIFRIIDITKPYPLNRLEDLHGGLGIVIDDCIAGVYTNFILLAILVVSNMLGMPVY